MRPGDEFLNFYNHDFVRAAVGIPSLAVCGKTMFSSEISNLHYAELKVDCS